SASTMVWPELTTIRQPVADMADTAIDILLREIRRPAASARGIVNHVLPHQLITRASVSRPLPDL
ncbi:MAG: substrate-binding domain-containing protein, partial [Stenotrophomonas maltophilia]